MVQLKQLLHQTTNDTADDADFAFVTNDGTTTSEIVRFKEDGKVGIGTGDPATKIRHSRR
jgi:hypothetical protein